MGFFFYFDDVYYQLVSRMTLHFFLLLQLFFFSRSIFFPIYMPYFLLIIIEKCHIDYLLYSKVITTYRYLYQSIIQKGIQKSKPIKIEMMISYFSIGLCELINFLNKAKFNTYVNLKKIVTCTIF